MPLQQLIALLLLLAGQPTDGPWGAQALTEAIELTDVDPVVLLAVALHETNMHPHAVGKVGETGPWQVHPVHRNHEYTTSCEVFPRNCAAWHAQTAARLLQRGMAQCGDLRGALAHYNRGHGCKGRAEYVAGVLREMRYVQELGGVR